MGTSHIDGAKELVRKLRQLPLEVEEKVVRGATASGARLMRDQARSNAAALFQQRTGTLSRSFFVKHDKQSSYARKKVVLVGVRTGRAARKAGKDAYYWWWLEFGTSKRTGTPFLLPAFFQTLQSTQDRITSRIAAGLRRESKRLGLTIR